MVHLESGFSEVFGITDRDWDIVEEEVEKEKVRIS
jgi:hypothetical protein